MDVFEVEEILLLVEEEDLVEVESFEVLLDFVEDVEETLTLDVVEVDFFELVLDDFEVITTEDTVAVEPV